MWMRIYVMCHGNAQTHSHPHTHWIKYGDYAGEKRAYEAIFMNLAQNGKIPGVRVEWLMDAGLGMHESDLKN